MSEGSHGAAMMQTVRRVPPSLRREFEAHVAASESRVAPDRVIGGHAIAALRSLWRRVPWSQQAALLADAISSSDFLAPHLPFLLRALRSIRERGERVFDGRLAWTRFAQLPDRVTAYRGAVQAETAVAYGISWTLNRARAVWYTTSGTRNWTSPAVLLTASVARDDIAGMLLGCGDPELLLEPEYTVSATVESLPGD